MPDLWFVPVVGVDPARVRLEHVHAAFSRWFDRSPAEHAANDKPYTLSPLTHDERGGLGVEIATLTECARGRLVEAAVDGARVRLGNQTRPVRAPRRLVGRTWAELAAHDTDRRWRLEFVTPATFRSGDRSSPMPRVDTILDGLQQAWSCWSDTRLPSATALEDPAAPDDLPALVDHVLVDSVVVDSVVVDSVVVGVRDVASRPGPWGAVWVSDLDLRSVPVSMRLRRRDGQAQPVTFSGVLGTLTVRCEDPATAAHAGPLLRAAAFCGVGGMAGKGLGVTRVQAFGGRAVAAPVPAGDGAAPRALDGHGSSD